MSFESVIVSDKLKSGSHAAVRFMDKDKASSNANKNNIFLFGNSSRKLNQSRPSSLTDLSRPGKPPDLVDIGTAMDRIINELEINPTSTVLLDTPRKDNNSPMVVAGAPSVH